MNHQLELELSSGVSASRSTPIWGRRSYGSHNERWRVTVRATRTAKRHVWGFFPLFHRLPRLAPCSNLPLSALH